MIRFLPLLCLLALLAGCAGPAVTERPAPPHSVPWAMEGGDPARTSRVAESPGRKWRAPDIIELGGDRAISPIGEFSAPIVVGKRVYFGSSTGILYALDAETLATVWTFPAAGGIYAAPAYEDGTLYFGDDSGRFYAVDLEGKKRWHADFAYPIFAGAAVADGTLYVVGGDLNVYCMNAADGALRWQFGKPLPEMRRVWRASSLALSGDRIFQGTEEGELLAIGVDAGSVIWRKFLGGKGYFPDVTAGPAVADGVVYAGARYGKLWAFRASDGETLWQNDIHAASGFAVGPELLYVGTDNGEARALSRADGQIVWTTSLDDDGAPGRPTLAGDVLLIGTAKGHLYGLDAATGEILERYYPGSGVSTQPWADRRGWIFLSNAGNVHRMKGSSTWD